MGTRKGKRNPMTARGKAEYIAALAPSAAVARRVFQDAEVRVAAREVFGRAAELSREVSGKKHKVGKLTRDEELQDDLTVLVRSMVHAIEGSRGAASAPHRGRRRGRRVAAAAVAAGTTAAGVAWARRRRAGVNQPGHGHDHMHDM